jgi:hypothetical protein
MSPASTDEAADASFREKAEVSKNPITNNMIIVIFI